MRATFITWHPHCRRSDAIAAALGARSHLVNYLRHKRSWQVPARYALHTLATLQILRRERPELVLVTVPPISAAITVWLYARSQGARFVVDAHSGSFRPARRGFWRPLIRLTRAVLVRADAVLVTGPYLQQQVSEWGARTVIIGDVPVHFGPGHAPAPCDGPRVVVVNTFSVDEPLDAVLAAARELPAVRFFVTGDLRYAQRRWLHEHPPNVCFTGFLPEADYAGLLRAAEAVIVLTSFDHTMQRGGYEAMALGKPLVISDWPLLRETFSQGTVHVRNEPTAIADGVRCALAHGERLRREMEALREQRRARFEARLAALLNLIGAHP